MESLSLRLFGRSYELFELILTVGAQHDYDLNSEPFAHGQSALTSDLCCYKVG